MQRCALVLAGVLLAAVSAGAAIGSSEAARLAAAAAVVQDIHTTIPAGTWSRARCVAVRDGHAFVTGNTASDQASFGFTGAPGYDQLFGGNTDGYILELGDPGRRRRSRRRAPRHE